MKHEYGQATDCVFSVSKVVGTLLQIFKPNFKYCSRPEIRYVMAKVPKIQPDHVIGPQGEILKLKRKWWLDLQKTISAILNSKN